jgi:hypothetical protein
MTAMARRTALLAVLAAALLAATPAAGDNSAKIAAIQARVAAARQKEAALSSQISSVTVAIRGLERRVGDVSQRLSLLERETDGFRIADADLALRGPGDFLGTRQAGLPDFRVANLLRDTALLRAARDEAVAWLEADPELSRPESAALRVVLAHRWRGRLGLARVG